MLYHYELIKGIQNRLYLPLNNPKSTNCQYWVNVKYDNELSEYQKFVKNFSQKNQIKIFCMEHQDFILAVELGLKQGLNIITI